MNGSEIISRVRVNLDDLSGQFFSDRDYLDSLQDGYGIAVPFSGSRESQATISLQGNLSYYDLVTLIPDFYRIIGIWSTQLKRWLDPVSDRDLKEERDDWEVANGEPRKYWIVNYRYIAIFPKPATTVGTLLVFYKQKADTLGLLSTPDIPVELHHSLEKYSTQDLLDQLEEFDKSLKIYTEWIQLLSEIKSKVEKRTYPDKLPFLKGVQGK